MYPRIGDKPESTQSQPSQKSIMQVITTRVLPATTNRPTRIKASCERGAIIVSPTCQKLNYETDHPMKAHVQHVIDASIAMLASAKGGK